LLGAMAVAGVFALGGLALAGGGRAIRGPVELVHRTARRLRRAATIPPEEPAFAAVEGLAPRITPIGEHYVVDTALVDPRVDQATWRLEIAGAVEAPYELTYDELLDLEAVEQVHTLECISNVIGGGLVGNAVWTGVPFPDLLARARPKAEAYDVVLRSVDGYSDSIRLAKALEPRTLVAYLMNGFVLPEEHGFPARTLVPDIYGMKNVKWLRQIELVTYDYFGFWMEQGWSDLAIVNTHSRIDVPRRDVRWTGGEIVVAGIANAGARGVAKVEVSTDAGETWTEARLERAISDLTWRRWLLRWTPPGEGRHTLLVRATDGGGLLQTRTARDPFPDGSTGWDEVAITVRRS
ncbi:MAG: molybdopterin-dependent oxidoreductase, partial [Candidatus Limnocylindria bacterium]